MIDTVRLLTRAQPTAEQLTWWNRHETNTPAGKCRPEYYFNPSPHTGIPIRATYRPESIIGPHLLQNGEHALGQGLDIAITQPVTHTPHPLGRGCAYRLPQVV